jgi:hypothetical protein
VNEGISINGPSCMHCDKMSLVNDTTVPESMFKKKMNFIAYQAVRSAVAIVILSITFILAHDNVITQALLVGE